jgi:hypothetical protein
MRKLSPEEKERKKAIFDSMSPRRQKHILKKQGYDSWDPFIEPKDPIDMRQEKSRRTAIELAREFLANSDEREYSNEFGRGVCDICKGLVDDDERYKGMYEFACWYQELLKKDHLE